MRNQKIIRTHLSLTCLHSLKVSNISTVKPQIIDCTIRDGGLVNLWNFSLEFVNKLYNALNEAGVEYMEIGYKNAKDLVNHDDAGPWRFCEESIIRSAVPTKKETKLSVMVDIGRFRLGDFLKQKESHIDMVRVACYESQMKEAIGAVNEFHKLGYETCLNIMAISTTNLSHLKDELNQINESYVDTVYIVDSFGSLYMDDISLISSVYQEYLPTKQIGIHAHNNLQLAFANTITGHQSGCSLLDSTVNGMGRAAGNCPTELLIGYLKPDYKLAPIFKAIEELLIPLKETEEWGYQVPYAISGQLNEHPREAITLRNSEKKDRYVSFYEKRTASNKIECHAVNS
ncbi:aldolase catalytic domain-containing protein [Pseudalkalibacillus berkeleyi]|uniref:Aldolase catalytic domain-containing protein n=1 Tax=Pseudalkalibacillus berkeleyi TaxID=1069813 RepID=A0ABS9GXL6_9BACL|nr:aldolase catalytic domain-containing protein [Pseudalkalibacillus berkeleyi]MCF6137439.1 aldolase catalytic domain-containing protein [Pseudalkalibacillus berkeleyi]